MEAFEDRVINGLLKAGAVEDPEQACRVLARDIEIFVDPARAGENDLWPAIWALAAVLERQFSGEIRVIAGLNGPLRQPAQLGSRCRFVNARHRPDAISIHLGSAIPAGEAALCGDARGGSVSYGSLLQTSEMATPLSCFLIAGYLGFAALATAAGVPTYRREFAVSHVSFPFHDIEIPPFPSGGIDFLGLGHLGQANLALLFFMGRAAQWNPRVLLIDKGAFEDPNWATQILVSKDDHWIGVDKAEYLKHTVRGWGWDVRSEVTEITWGWRPLDSQAEFAALGLDRFEPRRIAFDAGYSWIFDSGLGASFLRPRISWHSVPASRSLARKLFPDDEDDVALSAEDTSSAFIERLRNTPGECGLFTYKGVQASAPSLGLVASALVWSEILLRFAGAKQATQGSATVWSPILPYLRLGVQNSN